MNIVKTVFCKNIIEPIQEIDNPAELIEFFQSKINLIPVEHRERCAISIINYTPDVELELEISYTRPETADELAVRIKAIKKSHLNARPLIENAERQQLRILLEKYGDIREVTP